jgi:transposase
MSCLRGVFSEPCPPTAGVITIDLGLCRGDHASHEALLRRSPHEDRSSRPKNGMSKSATARLFGLSLSSVKRYARTADRGAASLTPRKGGGRPPKADEVTRKLLEADVEERPAATVSERRRFLECTTAKILSDSTIRRLLKRSMGFTQKNGLWGRQNETNGEEPSGG